MLTASEIQIIRGCRLDGEKMATTLDKMKKKTGSFQIVIEYLRVHQHTALADDLEFIAQDSAQQPAVEIVSTDFVAHMTQLSIEVETPRGTSTSTTLTATTATSHQSYHSIINTTPKEAPIVPIASTAQVRIEFLVVILFIIYF